MEYPKKYMGLKNYFLLLAVLFLFFPIILKADLIPSDRRINWTGNVGVEGGIPARTTEVNCTQAPYNVPTDGVTDATASIQACLNNIPVNQTAYLPTGTYIITNTITIPSYKTLRGAGQNSTIILNNSDITSLIFMGNQLAGPAAVDLSSGYTKGSTSLVVADASGFNIGDYAFIDEINDATIPVSKEGTEGPCTWCGRDNGDRSRSQAVKITGKSVNTLTVDLPLYFTFLAGNTPQIVKFNNPTVFAGAENMTVKNGTGAYTLNRRTNVKFYNAANCWMKNLRVDTCGYKCIFVHANNYRNEIRDSYVTKCLNSVDSDQCYGTLLGTSTSGTLIENNIYEHVSSVQEAWGASGNVFGYNYAYSAHRFTANNHLTWFWGELSVNHAAHPSYNLWEGNYSQGMGTDNIHGSSSQNTLFRNRSLGKPQEYEMSSTWAANVNALTLQKNTTYYNLIGNVFGVTGFNTYYEAAQGTQNKAIYIIGYEGSVYDPNVKLTLLRHANWDSANGKVKYCSDVGEIGCLGSDGSLTLPASLYLTEKPAWFGNIPWPPIGPDVPGYSNKIPAMRRFEGDLSYLDGGGPSGTTTGAFDLKVTNNLFKPLKGENVFIRYDLPADAQVKATIHDATGQKIRTIMDAQKTAGVYTDLVWDGKNDNGDVVASGTYFCFIDAGAYKDKKKIIMIK